MAVPSTGPPKSRMACRASCRERFIELRIRLDVALGVLADGMSGHRLLRVQDRVVTKLGPAREAGLQLLAFPGGRAHDLGRNFPSARAAGSGAHAPAVVGPELPLGLRQLVQEPPSREEIARVAPLAELGPELNHGLVAAQRRHHVEAPRHAAVLFLSVEDNRVEHHLG